MEAREEAVVGHGRSRLAWFAGLASLLGAAGSPRALDPVPPDPVMPFSSYLGGSGNDYPTAIGVAPDGMVWIVGATDSVDFPDPGHPGVPHQANTDGVVVRFDPAGRDVLSTLYYQGSMQDEVRGITFDPAGNAFVCGLTYHWSFPWTLVPGTTGLGQGDVFVSKIAADGRSILWTSVMGGYERDVPEAIALHPSGDLVVLGRTSSDDFPAVGAQHGPASGANVFVARLRGDGKGLVFSTRIGGESFEYAYGLALVENGDIVLCGRTMSEEFPPAGPLQDAPDSLFLGDAFALRLAEDGAAILWSVRVGGIGTDTASAVAVEPSGSVVVLGGTDSPDFPVQSPLPGVPGGDSDLFLLRVAADGSGIERSFRFGGGDEEWAGGLAVAPDGRTWVTGTTKSPDLPLSGAIRCRPGVVDPLVAAFDLDGPDLLFSTYLPGWGWDGGGGVAISPDGSSWVTGTTRSPDFLLAAPYQDSLHAPGTGGNDMFLARFLATDPSQRPEDPADLSPADVGARELTLQWEDRSDRESGYAVDRSEGWAWRRMAVLPPGTTTWSDTGLLPDHDYSYLVQALGDQGGSGPSNEATARTPATLDLRLFPGHRRSGRDPAGPSPWIFGKVSIRGGGPGETLDPVAEGMEIRAGTEEDWASGVSYTIPPIDPGWEQRGARLVWTPSEPWFTFDGKVVFRPRFGRFMARVYAPHYSIPEGGVARVRVTIGAHAGSSSIPWASSDP